MKSKAIVVSEYLSQRFGYSVYGYCAAGMNTLGFNAERLDLISRTYLLGNGYRAFSPVLMRFNQSDTASPFGMGGVNSYAYCMGDPINRAEIAGHFSLPGFVSRMLSKISTRTKKGPGQIKQLSKIESLRYTESYANLASDVKVDIKNDIHLSSAYELIGFHGAPKASEQTFKSGLDPSYIKRAAHGPGFYVSPSIGLANNYAGKDGKVYGVYTQNLKNWIHDRDYYLPTSDIMVIRQIAYREVFVLGEVRLPVVMSHTFIAYSASPPNPSWRQAGTY